MVIIKKIKELRKRLNKLRLKNKTVGFVPTMGALHEGHLSLMRRARRENDIAVVSIFVNPAQFGPKEDLRRYPRNLKRDSDLCRKEGVDFIFYPDANEMYPSHYMTYVFVSDLSEVLCGSFRPGHFQGVATIVTKLFNIVSPDAAYFGQKDAQQAIIIKKLACDLNMTVKIKVMPTIREKDGLALSSRNVYLSDRERQDALVLPQALSLARSFIRKGEDEAAFVINEMKHLIRKKETARIDYISIVDAQFFKPVKKIKGKCLIALAVWIGKTRLIDNMIVSIE